MHAVAVAGDDVHLMKYSFFVTLSFVEEGKKKTDTERERESKASAVYCGLTYFLQLMLNEICSC